MEISLKIILAASQIVVNSNDIDDILIYPCFNEHNVSSVKNTV